MANNFSEQYIRREIGNVMHPTINCSLVELGIVKNIEIEILKVSEKYKGGRQNEQKHY